MEIGKDGRRIQGGVLLCVDGRWLMLCREISVQFSHSNGLALDKMHGAPCPRAGRQGVNEGEVYLLALSYLLCSH